MGRISLIIAVVGGMAVVSGQSPAPLQSAATFEVASIKPANPATRYASSGSEGALWLANKLTVFMLIQRAYSEYNEPNRIVGGPSWIRETEFDIQAKSADVPTAAVLNAMLRNLLADRFGLRAHVEQRPLDVFVARLTRSDGRTGPWLVPTAPDCVRQRRGANPEPEGCDRLDQARKAAGARALTLTSTTMAMLFGVFREVGGLDRPIVDRTGLDGFYDVSVQYQSADPLNVTNGGTSLVAAAEDQLGLKFERGQANLDVLVIDAVDRPTPN